MPPTTKASARTIGAQALLFLVGAVAGTIGDQIHVQFHVLSYPKPVSWLFGQAIWVPFLFGAASIALVNGHSPFAARRPPDEPLPGRAGVFVPVLLFYLAYLSTGLFQDSPWLLTAGLTVAWAIRVAIHPSIDRVVSSIVTAIGGCIFEGLLSSTGAFHYRAPDGFYVPVWLPALYLHVALMTRHIYLAYLVPAPVSR